MSCLNAVPSAYSIASFDARASIYSVASVNFVTSVYLVLSANLGVSLDFTIPFLSMVPANWVASTESVVSVLSIAPIASLKSVDFRASIGFVTDYSLYILSETNWLLV